MTSSGVTTKFFGMLGLSSRWWSRSLKSAALAIALLAVPALTTASHAVPAPGANGVHVYLLRGVLNVFSLGLDGIAAKLEAQGIPVTITNYLGWSVLADEAAADYRGGKIHTIILVGHSSGATVLPDMVARLSQQGAPVKLAIGLDFSISHQPVRPRRTIRQLLCRQWQRRAGRADEATAWHARERERVERSRRRAPHDRKERDHAASGDQRYRCRGVRQPRQGSVRSAHSGSINHSRYASRARFRQFALSALKGATILPTRLTKRVIRAHRPRQH